MEFSLTTFLLEQPLFTPREFQIAPAWSNVGPIRTFCGDCGDIRTFQPKHENLEPGGRNSGLFPLSPNVGSGRSVALGQVIRYLLIFRCAQCMGERFFVLGVTPPNNKTRTRKAVKAGEFPALQRQINPGLERIFGKERSRLFKKGLRCEAFGFGIGAAAYYRRIVELVIDDLLDHIAALVPADKKKDYDQVLAQAKKEILASKKIELVKAQLPDSLRPGGHDPLGVLYGVLSQGLHSLSEKECLEDAQNVRDALEIFMELVHTATSAQKRLKESTEALLKRKSQRST